MVAALKEVTTVAGAIEAEAAAEEEQEGEEGVEDGVHDSFRCKSYEDCLPSTGSQNHAPHVSPHRKT